MAENAFLGKRQQPNDAELNDAFGSAKVVWDRFLEVLADEYGADIRAWKCYSQRKSVDTREFRAWLSRELGRGSGRLSGTVTVGWLHLLAQSRS